MTDRRGGTPTPTQTDDFSGFYGGAANIGAVPIMQGPEDMPDPPDSSWLDTLTASFRSGQRDIPGYNRQNATDEYAPLINRLTEANGKPFTAYVGYHTGTTDREAVWRDVEELRRRDPNALADLPTTRAEYDKREADKTAKRVEQDNQTVAHGPTSAWLLGGLGAGLTDPFNVGTMFVGGGGTTAIRRIITEGLANAGTEALEQPFVAAERADRGEKLTAGEALSNVVVAGLAGSTFQGLIGEPVNALLKRFIAKVPVDEMTDAERGAVSVLQRSQEIDSSSPFAPGAGSEAHVQRLDGAMRDVAAGLPGAAPTGRSSRASLRSGTSLSSGVVTREAPTIRVDVANADARAQFKSRVHHAEAGGGDDFNEASGAMGPYQFLASTWNSYYIRRYGRGGLSDAQIAAKRRDPQLNEVLMDDMTADNAAALRRIGARETAGNLYLEHFAGQGGASAILRAAPDTPIEHLLSPRAIEANPFLRGKTAHDVIEWAHRRMGESPSNAPVVRREQFASGEEGDAEWQAAQHESDLAERELERAQGREDLETGYNAEPGERQVARAGMAEQEATAIQAFEEAPPSRFGNGDSQSGYLASAGERQAARAELAAGAIDPNLAGRGSDWGTAEGVRQAEESTTFATAKGSQYVIEADGTTTRDKAARPEHPGESGLQPKSERTVYADPSLIEPLGLIQTEGGHPMRLTEQDGHVALQYTDGPNAGKLITGTVVPIHEKPAVGLVPIESWKNGERVHFGNEITEVGTRPRLNPGKAWAAAIDHGAETVRRAAPVANEVANSSGESGIDQVLGAAFSDPLGPAARSVAKGVSHDLAQSLESGELGDIAFAADGVETAHGGVEPRYRSARAVLAELDADDAAIAALEACL